MKQLIFIGGGHAHLKCLSNIRKYINSNAEITLISPSQYTYYSGMGPGYLGDYYSPPEIRFNVKEIAEKGGGHFINDKVVKINTEKQILLLRSGSEIYYDLISINVGSRINQGDIQINNSEVVRVKPIENLLKIKSRILNSSFSEKGGIYVIGGGPSGIEIAANLVKLTIDNFIQVKITLISDTRLLNQYPEKAGKKAFNSLKKRGVEVLEGKKVKKIENDIIYLNDGKEFISELTFLSTGTIPINICEDSSIPIAKDASMLVNSYLQSIKYDNIFGGGDCIRLQNRSLNKVGVYAVRESPILHKNILNYLRGGRLRQFKPQKKYLLILNMGNGKGIGWRGDIVLRGRFMFYLKHFIDKRFMKRFQISD